MDCFPQRPTLLRVMLLNTLCVSVLSRQYFLFLITHPGQWNFKFVLNYDLKLPSGSRSLNLPHGYFLLWKQQWGCFRELREACGFALGKITCLSYLGLETTKNTKDLSCLSVWETNPLFLPGGDLFMLLSCDVEHLALGCGFTSREFLFINYFKVKAKRGFASSHT